MIIRLAYLWVLDMTKGTAKHLRERIIEIVNTAIDADRHLELVWLRFCIVIDIGLDVIAVETPKADADDMPWETRVRAIVDQAADGVSRNATAGDLARMLASDIAQAWTDVHLVLIHASNGALQHFSVMKAEPDSQKDEYRTICAYAVDDTGSLQLIALDPPE